MAHEVQPPRSRTEPVLAQSFCVMYSSESHVALGAEHAVQEDSLCDQELLKVPTPHEVHWVSLVVLQADESLWPLPHVEHAEQAAKGPAPPPPVVPAAQAWHLGLAV